MSVIDTEPRVRVVEIIKKGHSLGSITLKPMIPSETTGLKQADHINGGQVSALDTEARVPAIEIVKKGLTTPGSLTLESPMIAETMEHKQENHRLEIVKNRHSSHTEELEPLTAPRTEESTQQEQVFEAIRQRRSVGQVTQQEPTREQIERMLEAATYAPSHHVTEPWHFFVLTGAVREELGRIMAASLRLRMPDHTSEKAQAQLLRERNKPLRAPVIITVAMTMHNMEGMLIENIEAAGAAVQNMLLAAQEMGLATLWRTGDTAYDPFVKSWLGMSADDHIVGFIYVGHPKVARPTRVPTHYSVKTTWL